jgi:hypothetical protein
VLLRGPALRQALLELLDTAGTPIDVNELVHVVLAAGWGLTGRPAQTVANALAVERRRGRVLQGVGHVPRERQGTVGPWRVTD